MEKWHIAVHFIKVSDNSRCKIIETNPFGFKLADPIYAYFHRSLVYNKTPRDD